MTSYQGGKSKLGKDIYEVIISFEAFILDKIGYNKNKILPYFEPFIGMGGVMKHFSLNQDPDNYRTLLASDANPDLILLWKELQKGWIPPIKCPSKTVYHELKKSSTHSALKGYIGITCSFGGIFFGGYRSKKSQKRPDYNYVKSCSKTLQHLGILMRNVEFLNPRSYDKFYPTNSLIYCDPPYLGNTYQQVTSYFKFDHDKFWELMRQWSKKNIVIISEYSAPEDFVCIWRKKFTFGFHKNGEKHKKCNECLFVHRTYFN